MGTMYKYEPEEEEEEEEDGDLVLNLGPPTR
jgi:hypothetical protein